MFFPIWVSVAMDILSAFLFPPPPSTFVNVMTVVSSTSLAMAGLSEIKGKHLQYSKFWNANSGSKLSAQESKLSSKYGMLLVYTPAFLAGAASFWLFPSGDERFFLLKSALTLHFFKRIFEVLSLSLSLFKPLLEFWNLKSDSGIRDYGMQFFSDVLEYSEIHILVKLFVRFDSIGCLILFLKIFSSSWKLYENSWRRENCREIWISLIHCLYYELGFRTLT